MDEAVAVDYPLRFLGMSQILSQHASDPKDSIILSGIHTWFFRHSALLERQFQSADCETESSGPVISLAYTPILKGGREIRRS